jgi:uncharacterized membrane protein
MEILKLEKLEHVRLFLILYTSSPFEQTLRMSFAHFERTLGSIKFHHIVFVQSLWLLNPMRQAN